MKKKVCATMLLATLNHPGLLIADAIEWNYNGKANAIGSGCSIEDTFFISAGDEVSVIFSNLGIELDGPQERKLESRKFCRIKVPALIKKGYYLSGLNSSLIYGLVRSEGTEAQINMQYHFLGTKYLRKKEHGKNPRESRNIPLAEIRDRRRIRNPKRCSGRDFRSVLSARASIVAKRKNTEEGIVIHLDGLSLRLDALATMVSC